MTLDNPNMTRDDEVILLKEAFSCTERTIRSATDENFYTRLIRMNKSNPWVNVYQPNTLKVNGITY